jgi:hypothetical protein
MVGLLIFGEKIFICRADNLKRKIPDLDRNAGRHNAGALYGVEKLPDIARPVVSLEHFQRLRLKVVAIIYMLIYGTDANIMIMLINIACCTWLISYAIALINVLYFRKTAKDFPRLWKVPAGPAVMVIGLAGLAYCMWTMRYVWLISGIAMLIFLLYGLVWFKYKKIPLRDKESVTDLVRNIQARSEELPEWDEAVNAWIATHGSEEKARA